MATSNAKNKPDTAEGGKSSQADTLLRLGKDNHRLVRDENGTAYAIDRVTGEVRRIDGKAFKGKLSEDFYMDTGKSVRSQSFSEAKDMLEGLAENTGALVEVNVRCALYEGAYVIDMGIRGNSRAIVVRPGKWTVTDNPGDVYFIRPQNMQPLPLPLKRSEATPPGEGINDLWSLVNVPEQSRLLVLTWLMDCLRPDTPFPLLEIIGQQGSAKSVTQGFLRRLIDPSKTDLRCAPRNRDDVFIGCANNWLLAYDNISHLSAEMQDSFCCTSTGAAFTTRKLYSDMDEVSVRVHRPVSINGISAAVTAQDLVDRTISIEIPTLQDRRERGRIEAEFNKQHGAILGSLLDLFAAALDRLPDIRIPAARRPRMLEFANLGCAVSRALGFDDETFLCAFDGQRQDAIVRTIDASPVSGALVDWLAATDRFGEEFTIKGLFQTIESWNTERRESWPRSAKGFGDALRRATPALRAMGIDISPAVRRGGTYWVRITRNEMSTVCTPSPACPASPEVLPDQDQGYRDPADIDWRDITHG